MRAALLFLPATLIVANPLHHGFYSSRRGPQSSPGNILEHAFSQGKIDTPGPSTSQDYHRRDGEVEPPAGTVWHSVKYHQWDQDHEGAPDKERVKAAWDMALALINKAVNQLKDLEDKVVQYENSPEIGAQPNGLPRNAGERQLDVRKYIAAYEPAYTQMFAADRSSIGLIHNNFEKIRDGIKKRDFEGRHNNPIYLTVIKNNALQTKEASGSEDAAVQNACAGRKGGAPAQAFVAPVSGMQWWHESKAFDSAKAPPENAWSINFCEDFFKANDLTSMLQKLKEGAPRQDICDLDQLESTERIILHEWTHLDFTLLTNDPNTKDANLKRDVVGYWDAAYYSINQGKATSNKGKPHQPAQVGKFSSQTAESYAWYAIYSYMNNLDGCAGVRWNRDPAFTAAQCAADVWPQVRDKKIVKNSWRCYWPGDLDKQPMTWCRIGNEEPTIDEQNASEGSTK